MIIRLFALASVALSISTIATAQNSKWIKERMNDDQSYLDYVLSVEKELKEKAVSVKVDPNFTSDLALWTYTMPDGSIVECKRGIRGGQLYLQCDER